jgi:hypothetical protein
LDGDGENQEAEYLILLLQPRWGEGGEGPSHFQKTASPKAQ